MPKKSTPSSIDTNVSDASNMLSKNRQPLVFISHDTRDADLAEEFSILLRNASAGALKSFRSSDKKGTQGIEYGLEWYPAIMDKIDEASDVVCLLTQHSVDRPWILYEAGVAKGKLNTKVIGISLGISLSEAVKGPFAQFQNNDGDVESITKLVYDLVKKVPGLDPDRQIVKTLVEVFLNKVPELVVNKVDKQTGKLENTDDNSVVKLFEEVKIMFQDLPSKIERRNDSEKRRSLKIHPKYLMELVHYSGSEKDSFYGFLIIISFFKNDFPWIYEMGIETYRIIKNSNSEREIHKAVVEFQEISEMTIRNPIIREVFRYEKETVFLFEELQYALRKQLDIILLPKKNNLKGKEKETDQH